MLSLLQAIWWFCFGADFVRTSRLFGILAHQCTGRFGSMNLAGFRLKLCIILWLSPIIMPVMQLPWRVRGAHLVRNKKRINVFSISENVILVFKKKSFMTIEKKRRRTMCSLRPPVAVGGSVNPTLVDSHENEGRQHVGLWKFLLLYFDRGCRLSTFLRSTCQVKARK
jgi:hypothetical protein